MTGSKPTRGLAIIGTRIWADPCVTSVVLVCEACNWQGIEWDGQLVLKRARTHWSEQHADSELPPFGYKDATSARPCRADAECTEPHYARGMCRNHYRRAMYAAQKEQA